MKKNKKHGFTLIELLAIIVILAIIAVITVPIILNIIEDSKKGSVQDSAYGYKDAVEKNYLTNLLDNSTSKLNGTYMISDGEFNGDEVNLSGTKPTKGYLIYENNKLTTGCLEFDGYKSIYSGDKFNSAEKGECELTTLYFSFDSTATMGKNGKITSKVTEENIPSEWTYWIKETTLNGVNNYQLQASLNQGMFDTESECLARIEENPDIYECKLVTEGYSMILSDGSRSDALGLFDTENECLSKTDIASNIFNKQSSCEKVSNKYSVFVKANIRTYNTESECTSHLNDETIFTGVLAKFQLGQNSCVPQTAVQYEVCGIYEPEGEETRNFCVNMSDESVLNEFPNINISGDDEYGEGEVQLSANRTLRAIYQSSKLTGVVVSSMEPYVYCGVSDPTMESTYVFAPAVCLNEI